MTLDLSNLNSSSSSMLSLSHARVTLQDERDSGTTGSGNEVSPQIRIFRICFMTNSLMAGLEQ